jgi:biopolymer transport protein ExbD
MRSKTLFWVLIVVFCVVLAFRLKQFYSLAHATEFLLRVGHFSPPENCEFKLPLVLHVSNDHTFRLNEEPESRTQLLVRLDMILKERLQPVLYIEGNSEIRMQEFVEVLDLVRKTNEKVEVRPITLGNRKDSCTDVHTDLQVDEFSVFGRRRNCLRQVAGASRVHRQ